MKGVPGVDVHVKWPYMSRSPLVVLPWSLQAIFQWQDEHWPLSFHSLSSLRWACWCQASWTVLLGRLCALLPLGMHPCTPPNQPSCLCFIMSWLGVDYSVRWVRAFNPQQCLRRKMHLQWKFVPCNMTSELLHLNYLTHGGFHHLKHASLAYYSFH